ncbi:MAG: hypothetical protein GY803_27800 [Chloroflexi bacterium]|nr:hypothetical protein [Chloroflexota bacterium]
MSRHTAFLLAIFAIGAAVAFIFGRKLPAPVLLTLAGGCLALAAGVGVWKWLRR